MGCGVINIRLYSLVIALAIALFMLMVPALAHAETDNYNTYATGDNPCSALTIPYNAADTNHIDMRAGINPTGSHVYIYVDGVQVCSHDFVCSYTWDDTEGRNATIKLDCDQGTIGYNYFVGGRRNATYGENPYTGVKHWSATPKFMYGRENELIDAYNMLVHGLVNSTLVWYLAMALAGGIVWTIIRNVFSAMQAGGSVGKKAATPSLGRGGGGGPGRGSGGSSAGSKGDSSPA